MQRGHVRKKNTCNQDPIGWLQRTRMYAVHNHNEPSEKDTSTKRIKFFAEYLYREYAIGQSERDTKWLRQYTKLSANSY